MKFKGMILSLATMAVFSAAPVFADEEGPGTPGGGETPSSGCTVQLAIDKIGEPFAQKGQNTSYLIALHNTGTCVLKDLTLKDYLAAKVKYVSAVPAPHHTPEGWGGVVVWKGEKILPGQTVLLQLTVNVSDRAHGFITDKACLTARYAFTPRTPSADVSTEASPEATNEIAPANGGWTWCDTLTQRVVSVGSTQEPGGW